MEWLVAIIIFAVIGIFLESHHLAVCVDSL